jgi:hypothetical protein
MCKFYSDSNSLYFNLKGAQELHPHLAHLLQAAPFLRAAFHKQQQQQVETQQQQQQLQNLQQQLLQLQNLQQQLQVPQLQQHLLMS